MRSHVVSMKITQEEALVGVTCNVCGRYASAYTAMNQINRIVVCGGYGSVYPEDSDQIDFDICGPCLKSWVETFQIPPDERSVG